VIADSGEVSNQYPKAQKVAEKTGEITRAEKDSDSGMFGNAFVTFLFLIVLLAGIWYWSDRNNGRLEPGMNRILGTQTLGEGVSLKIIKINQEVWVLGVTSQSVKLLHRYNENEWNEEMPVQNMKQENFMETFKKKLS
jgi:flagellar biogenesis protein FliO